ncbi:MAG: hypothetical protein ACK42D_03900 [Candidatus Paceibacteria bacterium]
MKDKTMQKFVVTAAGGNATAIGVVQERQSRSWYETEGKKLEKEFPLLGVEQVGFIVLSDNHFEMSGGEFCGNGSRAAGLMFAKLLGKTEGHIFTTSGHNGEMSVEIKDIAGQHPHVIGVFPSLGAVAKSVEISQIDKAQIVDLDGIVHIIVYGTIPSSKEAYEAEHRRITEELGLQNRSAVGVDWVALHDDEVEMHPVVWVRSIETFFYETSCGSGSISAAIATGHNNVRQPSGEMILVGNRNGVMTIASKMEVIHGT